MTTRDRLVVALAERYALVGPVTAKLCEMATSLQNTRFVKSARPDLQQNQAPRHHAPNVPGGKMSKDVVIARSAAVYKLLHAAYSVTKNRKPFTIKLTET